MAPDTKGGPRLMRVITWLPVGGIERRIVAVLPRLAARGWQVRLTCVRERGPLADELEAAGVPVDVVLVHGRLSPVGIARLAGHFRRHRPDVVHAHMYRSNVPATLAGRLVGVPAVFGHVHNVCTWESASQRRTDWAVSRLRTATFAVSERVRQDVLKTLGLPADRVLLLYNGIDTQAFRPDPDARRRLRAELAVAEEAPLLLMPARLHPQKNHAGLLDAFARVVADFAGGRAPVLVLAGDGPLRETLEQRANEAPFRPGQVRLLGRRDDMAALLNAADLVVLPSLKEGFSNAILEALACGKPVLASDAGGNAEALHEPAIGWVHPVGDAGRLESDLRLAVGEGVSGLAARGAACRRRAEQFSVEALVEATHRHYCRALGIAP